MMRMLAVLSIEQYNHLRIEFSFWLHLLDPERNGKTGKSMKRASTQNEIQSLYLHSLIKKCAIFKFNFKLKVLVLSE